MLNPLTDREKLVVETIRMRLTSKEALQYLRGVGMTTSIATYYRIVKKLEELKLKRMYHIAQIGFEDQHIERIDNCELALKLAWQNYHLCQDPYKRVKILETIVSIQPYLSSYYEATKHVMKDRAGFTKLDNTDQNDITATLQKDNNLPDK